MYREDKPIAGSKPHIFTCEIDPAHIDGNNHIGHEHFPSYFRRAREYLFEQRGIDIASLMNTGRTHLVLHDRTDYRGQVPLKEGPLEIHTTGLHLSFSHATFEQEMYQADKHKASYHVKYAFADSTTGKLTRPIPDDLRAILETLLPS